MVKFLTSLSKTGPLIEDFTQRGGKPLKDSLTLQSLLQTFSHVLPVSQLCKIVVCLQVAWTEKSRKFFVLVFLG